MCDILPKRKGSVGENVSQKLATDAKCDAATNLPEDAPSGGALCHQYFKIGCGSDSGANLKYVDAFPLKCQIACEIDRSWAQFVHAWSECFACETNSCHVDSVWCAHQLIVRRGCVFFRLGSDRSSAFSVACDHAWWIKASQGGARTYGYVAIDNSEACVGHRGTSDDSKVSSTLQRRTKRDTHRSSNQT